MPVRSQSRLKAIAAQPIPASRLTLVLLPEGHADKLAPSRFITDSPCSWLQRHELQVKDRCAICTPIGPAFRLAAYVRVVMTTPLAVVWSSVTPGSVMHCD